MTAEPECDEVRICDWCDEEFDGAGFGDPDGPDYCSVRCEYEAWRDEQADVDERRAERD
jgi:hypothetical protein